MNSAGFRDPKVLLPFLLITLIWSSTWIVIKGQLGVVPPIWSVSYRFLIAAAAMFAIARAANESAARLAAAAGGDRLLHPVEANELFIRVSAAEAAALRAQGFDFYDWGPGEARLVTSWDSDPAQVDALAAAIRAL